MIFDGEHLNSKPQMNTDLHGFLDQQKTRRIEVVR